MSRTRVVIQSRLNSSRLPGKAMLTIGGMPLIELVARRAARGGHEVVVATSEEHYDGRIADHLDAVGIPVVRGSLDDVLGRFVAATADLDDDDLVVRLTGDNPVADGGLVAELLAAMRASGHTYGRVDIDQVPEGLGAEGFPASALRFAAASTSDPYDREHVTPWLRRHFGELLFAPVGCPTDIHAYRATVDSLADYDRAARLFAGRSDVVDVPWQSLMAEVVAEVDALGPRAGRISLGGVDASAVALGTDSFTAARPGVAGATEAAARLRELLGVAVGLGVSHLVVAADESDTAGVVRSIVEPALTKRLRVVTALGALPSDLAPAMAGDRTAYAALCARLERHWALLGSRGSDVLAYADEAQERAWAPSVERLVGEGLIRMTGRLAGGLLTAGGATVRVSRAHSAPELRAELAAEAR